VKGAMAAGDYCAAPFTDCSTTAYYRARIEKRFPNNMVQVRSTL